MWNSLNPNGFWLYLPIRVRGELAGIVCIEQDRCKQHPLKREWRASEQNFVASLADFLAISLASAGGQKQRGGS